MRVALCSPVSISYYGGAEKKICEIAAKLVERGHEVKVYALPYTYEGKKVDPRKILGDISYEERWIHKIKADVSYIYYQPIIWRPLSSNGPSIAGIHSAGLFQCITLPVYLAYKLFGTLDLASFSAVHLLSPVFNVRHKKLYYIPNWIDTRFYSPSTVRADKFTILFVGRHRKEKGWPVFYRVCQELGLRGYDFDFICTGRGDNLVRGLGLVKEEMPYVYSKAHVVVYPSTADTFGLVIAEALACGTPVITTPIPSHTTLDLPLYYAWSVQDFIGKVLQIYDGWRHNLEEYEKWCSHGRQGVKKYDVKTVFPKFEAMLNEVAQGLAHENEPAFTRAS